MAFDHPTNLLRLSVSTPRLVKMPDSQQKCYAPDQKDTYCLHVCGFMLLAHVFT